MKTIVQRAGPARVVVDGKTVGAIEHGAVLLVGVQELDTADDAIATADKIARLRFFPGKTPMDRTLRDTGGACLVISQFTLAAVLTKGNRPGFGHAKAPDEAKVLYERVVAELARHGLQTATGMFGADMRVELVNDGPVTFLIETVAGKLQ